MPAKGDKGDHVLAIHFIRGAISRLEDDQKTVRQNTPFIMVRRHTCSEEFIGRLLHSKNFNLNYYC